MVLLLCQNDHVNPNQHSVLNDTLSFSYRQKFLPGWNIISITVKIKGQLTTTHKESQSVGSSLAFEQHEGACIFTIAFNISTFKLQTK
jgi:hypothetical protein